MARLIATAPILATDPASCFLHHLSFIIRMMIPAAESSSPIIPV